jgi:hypothetical protein
MRKIIAILILGIYLFAAYPFALADSFSRDELFDPIDPRLPSSRIAYLNRIQIARGNTPSLYKSSNDTSNVSGINKKLADYLNKPERYAINLAKNDFKFALGLQLKENWLGLREDNRNISNLQTAFTFRGKASIKDRIEFLEEITLFRSDSTRNLHQASGTGEFLRDPLLFYPPSWQGPIAGSTNLLDIQTDRAIIRTNLWGLELQTGRDRIQTKIGYRNGLLFSGLARPIDMFYKIEYQIGPFRLMAFSGQLTAEGKRYISAKRLSVNFAHNFQAGVTEAVAYYDDPTAYINPLMPIFVTQRQRPNNDDNLIASFDLSYTPVKNLNLYFEFMDDDFILFDGGASKYGFLIGLYKSQFLSEKLDLNLEYAQVRKWTYTHVTHINNWQYESQPFGFWLGPDADEIFCQLGYIVTPGSELKLGLDYIRKGEGTLFQPYEDTWGDKTPPFPSGIVEKATGVWLDIRHEIGKFYLTGRLGYRSIQNRNNQEIDTNCSFAHMALIYNL